MQTSTNIRPNLTDYSSIVCFKALITGMEDALGEKATAIALIAAGRTRGKKLAIELGLSGSAEDINTIAAKLNAAIGKEGTRLAAIDKIDRADDIIKVYASETLCSAGESAGSQRKCTFTLGAVWGALEEVVGNRLQGSQTEFVLRGSSHDVFEFKSLG